MWLRRANGELDVGPLLHVLAALAACSVVGWYGLAGGALVALAVGYYRETKQHDWPLTPWQHYEALCWPAGVAVYALIRLIERL